MIVRREIDEVHEHRATLDVTQELVAEAVAFVRAFDETGDVGDDERLVVIRLHDAEVRDERRERIVGDLRLRGADHGDERRLAGVRQTDDADVGDELELDEQLALFAFFARLREARAPDASRWRSAGCPDRHDRPLRRRCADRLRRDRR